MDTPVDFVISYDMLEDGTEIVNIGFKYTNGDNICSADIPMDDWELLLIELATDRAEFRRSEGL